MGYGYIPEKGQNNRKGADLNTVTFWKKEIITVKESVEVSGGIMLRT